MFHNATAIYAYGFDGGHAQRILAHVRGSVHTGNLEVHRTSRYHPEGIMLVYRDSARYFRELCESLGFTPRNVILYPAGPEETQWDKPAFIDIYARRTGSPFEEFQRLLGEIDAELGAVKKS